MDQHKGFLGLYGLVVPMCTLQARLGNKLPILLNKLTIVHRQKVGPPKRALMYKYAEYNGVRCIHLPRTLAKNFLDNKILTSVDMLFPPLREIPAQLCIDLFGNQQILIKYLLDNIYTDERIASGTACALLNLRAGMGKTFVAAGIIARLGLRALYIVPKRPLMVQAVKDLRACFYPDDGLPPPMLIGPYGKTKKKDPNTNVAAQGVTVIVINSALDRDTEFFRGYSLVIYDEVHSYCSDTRREIFRKASASVCLGMTATSEDRNDGFDPIAHKELAFDGIIRADAIPEFTYEDVEFECEAKIINYSGPESHTHNLTHEATGKVFTHYMHNQYINDKYRLQLAVDELIALYDWRSDHLDNDGLPLKHNIYVFAEELEILKTARTAFIAALATRRRGDIIEDIDLPEDTGLEMFTGGLKDDKITDIVKSGRILFSTFGYAGTGISILKMSAMLFLTPRKANMKQIIARILRRGSDTRIPRIVVDIVDKKTALQYQVGSRKLAYDFYGFVENLIKLKYTDIVLHE